MFVVKIYFAILQLHMMQPYELTSKPSGHVLIVNNMNFKAKKRKRFGSDEDERNLITTFKALNFETTCHRDVKAKVSLGQKILYH